MASPALPKSAPRLRGLADFVLAFPAFLLVVGLQSPGKIVSDTKYDLLVDPVGFLSRSVHIWTDESFSGQVQNQSYGYFFPQGAFFAVGQLAHVPPWITERLWWALALTIGFTGIYRLARALGIGRTPWQILGALAYVGAPKVLTSLGTISSEIWPMMLAPWAVLAIHKGLTSRWTPRRAGAAAALAVALMGAVNAVATVAACLPALLWLLTSRPNRTWRRLAGWWVGLSALVSLWWIVPLVVLGSVAPPFLDYIESAAVTSRWSALVEVLRGSSSWVPYISPNVGANEQIVATPLVIIATVVVAGTGLVGLAWPGASVQGAAGRGETGRGDTGRTEERAITHRGRLALMAGSGLLLLTAAYAIPGPGWITPSFPFAEAVQDFLDGAGAPLRNAHKWEPVLRLPLVLAAIYFFTRAAGRLPKGSGWRPHALRLERIERYPSLAAVCAVVLALVLALTPVWRGELAANGPHESPAEHWSEAADWLATNAADSRALVAPGSSFGVQVWGTSRDEPIQPLADSPWAVRDSIPLQPAPAIRALDSVQRVFDSGRPSPGLSATLTEQGIGYVVVRSDLVPQTGGTRPALVHQALRESGGFTPVARFGEPQGAAPIVGESATATVDSGLRPQVPSIVIYRVGSATDLTPYSIPLDQVPQVAGGPEALARLDDLAAMRPGSATDSGDGAGAEPTTRLLAKDAEAAGAGDLGTSAVIGTDTPGLRETDFGRASQSTSALRTPGQERTTLSPQLDYAAQIDPDDGEQADPGAGDSAEASRTHLRWRGGEITASSSAGAADEPGPVAQGKGVAALADRDERTTWHSRGGDGAFGQSVRVDFDVPRDRLVLTVQTPGPEELAGSPVVRVNVETDTGSTVASITPGEPSTIALPTGASTFAEVTAVATEAGTRGFDFAISELGVRSGGEDVTPRREVVVPASGRQVLGWSLGAQYPGRSACMPEAGRIAGPGGRPGPEAPTACEAGFAVPAEEPGEFTRTLDSAREGEFRPLLSVRARAGGALDALLTAGRDELTASGDADVDDPLGNALAAVDGDPGTAWRAPQSVVDDEEDAKAEDEREGRGKGDDAGAEEAEPAELRIGVPERGRIGSVRIWPTAAVNGARPEVVEIEIGDRTERVDLTDTEPETDGSWILDIPDATASEATIRVLEYSVVRNDAGSGFDARPPAIGDVRLLGTDGLPLARPLGTGEEPIRVPCSEGPVIRIRDAHGEVASETRMTVTTTVDALRRGEPVLAAPCDDEPTRLPAGEGTVTVDPGPALSVDGLELSPASARAGDPALGEAAQDRANTVVEEDGPARRVLELTTRTGDAGTLLVVPQSYNTGWNARLVSADGKSELTPIPVGGWQQGWILPAGVDAGAKIVMDFPLDGYYRAALATGPFALILVLWLLLARGHDRAGAASEPRRGSRRWWLAGGAVTGVVIGGVPGLALFAVAVAGLRVLPRRAAPVLIAGALGVAAMLVAREPWPGTEWGGDSIAAQLLALAALAVVFARGALDYPRRAPEPDAEPGADAGTTGRSGA